MGEQKQEVEKNSIAFQVGGDINIGLRYGEIKEIFYDLFKQNFPALVSAAAEEAKRNVDVCFKKLEERLIAEKDNVKAEKFSEANTQFLLNDAIQICARKGRNIDIDALLEAFMLSVRKDSTSMLELVAEQVLSVFPRLTAEYISVLTVIQTVAKVRFYCDSLQGLDDIFRKISNCIDFDKNLSQDVGLYLDSLGLVSKTSGVFNPYKNFLDTYKLALDEGETLQEGLEKACPYVKKVFDYFIGQKIDCLIPTPSGMLIALMNMKKIGLGNFDYKTWIN